MADVSSIINALKGMAPDAMPFGVGGPAEPAIESGAPGVVSALMGLPKHLIESSANAVPGLRREDVTDLPGKGQPNDPMYNASAETALSLAGVGMPAAEAGAAGIFGGRLAKTADLKALQEAERMRNNGAHPNDVWGDTGWFRSPTDGKWRFEIPDNRAMMRAMPSGEGDMLRGKFGSFLDHPELYKAYPDFQKYPTMVTKDSNWVSGQYSPAGISAVGPSAAIARSTLLHEGQHGIQAIEGFTPGANHEHYAALIEKGLRAKPEQFAAYDFNKIKSEAENLYHKTAGEVEARNVQHRQDYYPMERRAVAPWETQDVKFNDQLAFDPYTDTLKALRRK